MYSGISLSSSLLKFTKGSIAAAVILSATGAASLVNAAPNTNTTYDRGGVVYIMKNGAQGNVISVFQRKRNGDLQALPAASAATGGLGGGDNAAVDPLGSQSSLYFDDELHMLFAVNAGDNSISVLQPSPNGRRLTLLYNIASGGKIPVSLKSSGGYLYVLNAGESGSVATFKLGKKKPRLVNQRSLGLSNASSIPFDQINAPGQVGLDELNRQLVITHGGGQEVLTIALNDKGIPSGGIVHSATPGVVPFSFAATDFGNLLVTEAGSGAVTSFNPPADGSVLQLNTASVANGQAATCWIVVHDKGFAYVSNTASDTISSYTYSRTGQLTLLNDIAGAAIGAPTDITLAAGGRFLYSLNPGSGTISGFAINPYNGRLREVDLESGLPAGQGIQGIAAFDF